MLWDSQSVRVKPDQLAYDSYEFNRVTVYSDDHHHYEI